MNPSPFSRKYTKKTSIERIPEEDKEYPYSPKYRIPSEYQNRPMDLRGNRTHTVLSREKNTSNKLKKVNWGYNQYIRKAQEQSNSNWRNTWKKPPQVSKRLPGVFGSIFVPPIKKPRRKVKNVDINNR